MNKEELVKKIAKKTKLTQKESLKVLLAIVATIKKQVSKGRKVSLVRFGTFGSKKRAPRTGRNPQTGAVLEIAAKTVPVFTPGKNFKERVNKVKTKKASTSKSTSKSKSKSKSKKK